MTTDLLALMWLPFLTCLVLTGIHAYLGFHVIAHEVVFVDIALAQIAALGATAAFLFGFELETWQSYAAGLAFTILGALVLALTRSRRRLVCCLLSAVPGRCWQTALVGIRRSIRSRSQCARGGTHPTGHLAGHYAYSHRRTDVR